MKILSYGIIISLFALTGCKQESASTTSTAPATDSTAIKITAPEPSPHFTEVMSHLDIGGKSLHFQDHEGRREFWIGMVEMILSVVPEEEMPVKINATELVDAGGFMDAAASGRSLSKEGKGWLMRHYTSYPDGLPNTMKIYGEKQPFVTASRLPAETDLSLEARIDATMLPEMMRNWGKMLGQEKEIEKGLKEPTPFGADVETLIAGMDLHILLGLDVETTLIPQMPVIPKNIFIQISAKKELLDRLMPILAEGLGEATAIDDMKAWPLPIPAFPGLVEGEPHLVYDGALSLTIVSSLQHFKEVRGDGKKLADQPLFQAATNHFDSSGNLLFYASPAVIEATLKWTAVAASDTPEALPLLSKLEKLDKKLPWAFYVSCEEKGIRTLAKVPYAIDSSSATTLTLLSATSTLFVGARAWKKGSDRSACIMQTRNVQQAIRGHQNMNAIDNGAPINWNDIFGPDGYLPKPTCPLGGTYTFVDTYPPVGTLACQCSHADHVPENHEGW